MNYKDIFYTILHETNFFNSFFYEQYILDLDIRTVYNVYNQEQYPLDFFIQKNNISPVFTSSIPFQITSDYIMITPQPYPQYRIVLKINLSLTHFRNTPDLLLSQSHTPIHHFTNLTKFLKVPTQNSSYILFFDFLTNQNLETPEIKNFIFQMIVNVFQREICYFQQFDYHQYYLLLKDIDDIQIFNYCKVLKKNLQNYSKIYVLPRFLLVECQNFHHFDILLYKIKKYFQEYIYDTTLLIVKEKEAITEKYKS